MASPITKAVTVGTTAVKLTTDADANGRTQALTVRAINGSVYLGGPDVTTANGFLVAATDPGWSFDLVEGVTIGGDPVDNRDNIYAISAGSVEIRVFEDRA